MILVALLVSCSWITATFNLETVRAYELDYLSSLNNNPNNVTWAVATSSNEENHRKSHAENPHLTRRPPGTKRSPVLSWINRNHSSPVINYRSYDYEDDGQAARKDYAGTSKSKYRPVSAGQAYQHPSGVRKLDYGSIPGIWKSKKDKDTSTTYNSKKKNNNKYFLDIFDDYLGSESHHDRYQDEKYHDISRKYIHEHEGIFFPVPVPSHHHEKEDSLLPLLLLLLLPLLLFAIIIPLNANLLSTLFLIMQNNASAGALQLAGGPGLGRRKKRQLPEGPQHPSLDGAILEVLTLLDSAIELYNKKH